MFLRLACSLHPVVTPRTGGFMLLRVGAHPADAPWARMFATGISAEIPVSRGLEVLQAPAGPFQLWRERLPPCGMPSAFGLLNVFSTLRLREGVGLTTIFRLRLTDSLSASGDHDFRLGLVILFLLETV